MLEPTYTIKEIMDIQFKGIDHKLDSQDKKTDLIIATLREQNVNSEKRYADWERKLEATNAKVDLQDKTITKIMAIGGAIWSAVTLLGGFLLNRIF